jgi:purine-nucleoside/S-methyl-5'-thioadenosine phosphorylase / adenosine deaminase
MIQAPSLVFPSVRHAFFTRAGGVSSGIYESLNGGIGSKDAPENVQENRARMAATLGVAPTHLVSCYQIHSPDVIVATKPWTRENSPRADAIVTGVPGLAVGVGTADCGPVLFADGEAGVVGAAHAGWKGALTGVLEATVAAMEKLGATRARICAAIGPLIRQPNYEVGPEFFQRFVTEDDANGRFFVNASRIGYAMFDLPGYIRSRLERTEIASIEDLGLCTYADPARFFSYRRTTHRGEPDYGRHVNAIALVS